MAARPIVHSRVSLQQIAWLRNIALWLAQPSASRDHAQQRAVALQVPCRTAASGACVMWRLRALAGLLVSFHASEFVLAHLFMRERETVSIRSLLITRPYVTAMGLGVLEFLLELWLLPSLKACQAAQWLAWPGLVLAVLGDVMRKTAMVTAQANFTHDIQHVKRSGHTLVTHGIYRYIRHPGYLGWFIWSLATQVLLANPLCLCGYAVVAWRFFKIRIAYEEWTLKRFFGASYEQYAARTPTWIPGIK